MARVPVVVENTQTLRPITNERYDASDQTAVGRTIGAGLQRLGSSLSEAAQTQDRIDAIYDEARAKQLDNEYQAFERNLLFGEGGFYSKQNADALNARAPAEKAIADQVAGLTAKATTPRERSMLTNVLARRSQETLGGIGRYSQGQAVQYAKVQSQARISNATDNYVVFVDDETRGPAELATIKGEVRSQAALLGLQDAGVIHAMEADALTKAHSSVVENKAISDPVAAATYLDKHRDQIDPTTQIRLDRALHPALVARDAKGLADIAMGEIPLPSVPADAPADASANGQPGGQAAKGTVPFTVAGLRNLFRAQESNHNYTAINEGTGALGAYQVMPATGAELAKRVGLPWRPDLMRQTSPEAKAYQDRIGDAAIKDAIDHSGGDPRTAFQYYYGGSNRRAWGSKTRKYGNEMMVRFQGGDPRSPSGAAAAAAGGGGGGSSAATGAGAGDLGLQLATVERVGRQKGLSDEIIEAGKAEVERRFGIARRIQAEREDTAKDAALESVLALGDNFTSVTQIPNFGALSATTRLQMKNWADINVKQAAAAASAAAIHKTDSAKWATISDAYASDPKSFLAIRPEQARGFLDDGDFNTYLGWRRDAMESARGGGNGKTPQWNTEKDIMDVSKTLLAAAGLKTGDSRDAQKDAPRIRAYTVSMLDWSKAFKAQNGRLPNSEEIRKQADRFLIEGSWKKEGDWGRTTGYGFEAPGGRMSPKVPDDIRNRILRVDPNASEEEISRLYVRGKGVKW